MSKIKFIVATAAMFNIDGIKLPSGTIPVQINFHGTETIGKAKLSAVGSNLIAEADIPEANMKLFPVLGYKITPDPLNMSNKINSCSAFSIGLTETGNSDPAVLTLQSQVNAAAQPVELKDLN